MVTVVESRAIIELVVVCRTLNPLRVSFTSFPNSKIGNFKRLDIWPDPQMLLYVNDILLLIKAELG